LWDIVDLGPTLPPLPLAPVTVSLPELDEMPAIGKEIFKSIVKVKTILPCRLDGYPKSKKIGAGLVLNRELGWVCVSRNLVPSSLAEVTVTIADIIELPAKVTFLHPTHNYSILEFDASAIGKTPIQSASLDMTPLKQGESVYFVAMNHNQRPVCVQTTITDVSSSIIPPCANPRFRAINFGKFWHYS
jgi:hypothetical protein